MIKDIIIASISMILVTAATIAFVWYLRYEKITKKGLKNIAQWMIVNVFEAEMEYGAKTGPIKMSYVYNKFVVAFPKFAKKMSLETFITMLDAVLEQLKPYIEAMKVAEEQFAQLSLNKNSEDM